MIITCPNCSTRYTVGDSAMPAKGRKVRCASCGHVWHQGPASDGTERRPLVDDPFANAIAAAATPAPRPAPQPAYAPPEPRRPARKGGRGTAVAWGVFATLLAGVLAGGYLARAEIVRLWPPAALLYETVGLPVDLPGAGLQLQNVRSEQRVDGGATVLLVEGQIVNVSDAQRPVPKVRAVSLGFDRKPVQVWTIDASSAKLLPGEIATFSSTRPDPGAVAEVMVTFEGG